MRRADRLFQIVDLLRPGRLTTARDLAQRLEVSDRTIYRDIADLIGSGVPIEGAAGAGYLMRAGYDLPPLMLTRDEASALVAGARMMRAFAGTLMQRAAGEALDKILAVLPPDLKTQATEMPLYAIGKAAPDLSPETRERLDQIETAITQRHALDIAYAREDGTPSTRRIQPGVLLFWGKVWTIGAWCDLRQDYRGFRVDRMEILATGPSFTLARAREIGRAMDALRGV
jgi:predicted DNA-binding transcriptional regulator YafY